MMKNLLLVGVGGAGGSMLRFILQRLLNTSAFPYGTLIINLTGCLIIGLLWGWIAKSGENEIMKFFLMTGFCGGFTTFSAFSYESLQMLTTSKWFPFLTYVLISVIGGLLATFTGYKISN